MYAHHQHARPRNMHTFICTLVHSLKKSLLSVKRVGCRESEEEERRESHFDFYSSLEKASGFGLPLAYG